MNLPVELKSPRQGSINIKKKIKKVRYINPSKEHPERILKNDK